MLTAHADDHNVFLIIQRANGVHIQGAGQTLSDQTGFRCLINGHAADQFGRILIELDTAIVAGADDLATVEQRGGKIRRESAYADDLRAASDTLCRNAWKAGDRFGNADVWQLANVFGRNSLDDLVGRLLGSDCTLNTLGKAADFDDAKFGGLLLPGLIRVTGIASGSLLCRGRILAGCVAGLRSGGVSRGGRADACRSECECQHITFEYHRDPLPGLSIILFGFNCCPNVRWDARL